MANPFDRLTARTQAAKQAAAEEKQRQEDVAAAERAEEQKRKTENHEQIAAALESFGVNDLYRTLFEFCEAIEVEPQKILFSCYGSVSVITQKGLEAILQNKNFLLSKGEWVLERDTSYGRDENTPTDYLGIQVYISADGIAVNGTQVGSREEMIGVLEEVELSQQYVSVRREFE